MSSTNGMYVWHAKKVKVVTSSRLWPLGNLILLTCILLNQHVEIKGIVKLFRDKNVSTFLLRRGKGQYHMFVVTSLRRFLTLITFG